MSRTFNKKYLIPFALIILLLMAFAWLAYQYANSGNSLIFYLLGADLLFILVLLSLIVRKVFIDHTNYHQSQERLAEAIKEKDVSDNPELKGRISRVVKSGYQYIIDDENIKIVRTARVKLYG